VKASFALKEAFTTMHQDNSQSRSVLPHHRLVVYQRALEFLAAVRGAQISDAKLRDEALRAAKGVCLNIAEGSGRVSRADKARAYAIARGECVECIAAVEIAVTTSDAVEEAAVRAVQCGTEVCLMLGALVR
jgi:four helix bundle protein